ncbi:MAG TPA: transporter substrate-binding domain-containing protein [Spongiibacteraceae bacterium]|nr:transporter substrate-binding domain-containing protein [Spongiibacteraceae bacterium]
MAIFFRLLLAIAVLLAGARAVADDKAVRLISLDWQPYTGASLRDQGVSAAVVKAAFQAMGYAVDIDFYPWARATHLSESDNDYAGVFPVYYSADRARRFNCSNPIGHSPLGFAERNDARVAWSVLGDLAPYKIGVVRDYVNTQALDDMVATGRLAVDVASNDAQNLQKLAHRRIDLAIVDRNVLDYLLKNTPELQGFNDLRFNSRLLEDRKLYICFKRGGANDRVAARFNAGLQKIDVEAIIAQYMQSNGLEKN